MSHFGPNLPLPHLGRVFITYRLKKSTIVMFIFVYIGHSFSHVNTHRSQEKSAQDFICLLLGILSSLFPSDATFCSKCEQRTTNNNNNITLRATSAVMKRTLRVTHNFLICIALFSPLFLNLCVAVYVTYHQVTENSWGSSEQKISGAILELHACAYTVSN